jgi:hypothetical protein
MIFDWDVDFFSQIMLPHRMRMERILILIRTLLSYVKALYEDFLYFRQETLYGLSINGQTCYLRSHLNYMFDETLQRITIEDASSYDRQFIFIDPENQPVFLNVPFYIEITATYLDTGYDFYVKLNGLTLSASETERMKAAVSQYKLAGKRFLIIS